MVIAFLHERVGHGGMQDHVTLGLDWGQLTASTIMK